MIFKTNINLKYLTWYLKLVCKTTAIKTANDMNC